MSLLCAFRLVLCTHRFAWVILLGAAGGLCILAGLLSRLLYSFPKKLEVAGETHSFLIASVFDISSEWDFQSRS